MFEELLKKCDKLMKEVQELKSRINELENLIEFPFKVGDTMYHSFDTEGEENQKITRIFTANGGTFVETDWYLENVEDYNISWFTDKAKAEERLKELNNDNTN